MFVNLPKVPGLVSGRGGDLNRSMLSSKPILCPSHQIWLHMFLLGSFRKEEEFMK